MKDNLNIYCTTIEYFKVMDNFPNYIKPLGLGETKYPQHWLSEKKGKNILSLNKYYAELTGIYWIWKNQLDGLENEDLLGNCHYRVLWLNEYLDKKKKFTTESLHNKLLKIDNFILNDVGVIQVQPVKYSNKNLLEDFKDVHKCDALDESVKFFEDEAISKKFLKHLKGNVLYPHNMFITKKIYFDEYCKIIFPWLEKCLEYCLKKNLCINYNLRLPAFLAERFTSFWFSEFDKRELLSYARLGKFHLSNKLNKLINTTKIPFTYYQYPTIHRY